MKHQSLACAGGVEGAVSTPTFVERLHYPLDWLEILKLQLTKYKLRYMLHCTELGSSDSVRAAPGPLAQIVTVTLLYYCYSC